MIKMFPQSLLYSEQMIPIALQTIFHCENCGSCCSGKQESVSLLKSDVKRLSEGLGISKKKFIKENVIQNGKNFVLKNTEKKEPCVFYKQGICSTYSCRPMVCRAFPFLSSVDQKFVVRLFDCPGIIKLFRELDMVQNSLENPKATLECINGYWEVLGARIYLKSIEILEGKEAAEKESWKLCRTGKDISLESINNWIFEEDVSLYLAYIMEHGTWETFARKSEENKEKYEIARMSVKRPKNYMENCMVEK